ncbi:meiosis inhibitor protein 1-like [Oculina patagonica]
MELAENSLSFFTTNHSKHDSQWRMTGANVSFVCVACLVELLENLDVLHLRKRKALREVVFLLSNGSNLLELLSQNARITSHLCGIIIDLLSSENELLMNTAIEALDIVTLKLRSENLVAEIVEKLETQIMRLNNLHKSYPFVLALGRLLKSIPALSQVIAMDSSSLVEYLLSNMLIPEDNIKAAFLFVLVQICSNDDALNGMSLQIKEKICKQTCAVINCSVSMDTQANALGVLKLFASQPDVLNSVLKTANKGTCDMLESLKKLMLSPNEAIQIGAIQCITQLLRNDPVENDYTRAFLTSGIGEMLLEDLECSNDIILGSVFCCLDHMARTQIFYTEGYSVYGIESVIVGVSKAIKLKNHEVIRQAIRVLALILSKQPSNVQLFSNEELCKKCASVLYECLKSADHKVLTQAANAVVHFLSITHFPPSMEFEAVVPLVSTMITHVHKFTKPRMHFRNIPKGALEGFLCALLEVIQKCFQFVKEYRDRKPSYAALLTRNKASVSNENEALDQFLESLWKAIDQTCVPALMVNCKTIENQAVFKNFFEIFHLSVSPLSTCRDVFARKLASGSFIRLSLEIKEKFCGSAESRELGDAIANFLAELCLALGNATDKIQLGELLKTSNIVGIHSSTTCLNLLTQSSVRQGTSEIIDDPLFSTQCACIELMYVSFAHGDENVPVEHLMTSLHKYLVLHPDVNILPRVSLKHFLFLWMGSYSRLRTLPLPAKVVESMKISQEILQQGLVKFKAEEFESIYIHDVLFVSWIFSCKSLAQAFGRQVLICFLETEKAQNSSNDADLHQLLASNTQSFRTFVSLVDCTEEAIANRVVTVLEALISGDSNPSANISMSQLSSIAIHLTNIFHKLFLGHKAKPLQEHSITAMLNVMTAVQMKIPSFDIKLLYHVINLLTSTKCYQTVAVSAINYLNVSLAWDTNRDGQRVAAVLLSSKAFCSHVQEVLNAKLVTDVGQQRDSMDDVNLLASVLVLISSLATSQTLTHNDIQDAFRIDKKCMIKLANERQNILGVSGLIFWDVFFKTSGGAWEPCDGVVR